MLRFADRNLTPTFPVKNIRRLTSLQKTSQELNQLTRTSASTYAEFAKDFTVAARVARVIRRDLGIASYRLE
jgi:hypothetical protein